MADIEVTEDYKGLQMDSSTEGITIEKGFTRRFEVLFLNDSISMMLRPYIAFEHIDIPREWDSHPLDNWLYVNKKTARAVNPLLYEVIVDYVSDPDPLNQPPDITWSFATSNEPIDTAIVTLPDGEQVRKKPIVNSAGESFDPPITMDFDDLLLRIERNEEAFNDERAERIKGAVNEKEFFGFLPGKVKCTVFDGIPARAAWLKFYRVNYEFQIRRDGWKRRVLDQGFRTKTGVDSENKPIYAVCVDSEGIPLSQPSLFDGLGQKLKDGVDAVFMEFNILLTEDFSVLGLD